MGLTAKSQARSLFGRPLSDAPEALSNDGKGRKAAESYADLAVALCIADLLTP